MGKIAFVFSGQGAQTPGMGLSLYKSSPAARKVFQTADSLRPGTSRQCFYSTEEELCETKNTQPCLFTVEMATAAALAEAGIQADMAAGFSLGEISALSYSQAVDFATGLMLVMHRGALMQAASEKRQTRMAAVLKLSNDEVRKICSEFPEVYPVNYNCPGQVSVSGVSEEMQSFSAAVKAAGGRSVPLKVSGAFHSPFMTEAAEAFARELVGVSIARPTFPLYSNYTGTVYGQDIKATLARQIDHPVQWETIIREMIKAGADTFFELGPGKTLCNFIKKIDPSVKTFGIGSPEDLTAAWTEVKTCSTERLQSLRALPVA